jgi:hypothetical protein
MSVLYELFRPDHHSRLTRTPQVHLFLAMSWQGVAQFADAALRMHGIGLAAQYGVCGEGRLALYVKLPVAVWL